MDEFIKTVVSLSVSGTLILLLVLEIYMIFAWSVVALVLLVRKITIYQDFIQYIKICNTEVSEIEILNLLSDCEERLRMKTRVELYRNSLLTSPIMIGFFRPSIILPDTDLGDKGLSYIFLHELTHYKQKDMFYKWLVQILFVSIGSILLYICWEKK